jgi:PAS domain S-box-containing protein
MSERTPKALLLTFGLLTLGIVASGYLYYRHYELQYRVQVERQLLAVTDLKVHDLVNWRTERLAEGEVFRRNPVFSSLVWRTLTSPRDAEAERLLRTWLSQVRAAYGYDRLILLDDRGVARIAVPGTPEPASAQLARDAADVLRSGQKAFLDFHREAPSSAIYLAVLAPIRSQLRGGRPLGVLVLRINPATYLYPSIQRWPVPSPTSEILIVRRDGNDVLYLNALRFRQDAALNLRFPLTDTELPAVRAVLGREGITEGSDYRGKPVVAAVRSVTGSPWFVVAKTDVSEAYAPLTQRLWAMGFLVVALVASAGAAVGWIWRQGSARFYRERYEGQRDLGRAEENLRRLATVVRDSNDAITIQDFEGGITAWNRGAELMYGYSEPEALAANIERLTASGKVAEQKDFIRRLAAGEAITSFETQRVTKDGRVLDVWMTVTKLMDEAGKPIGLASTERDITARKRAVDEVHKLNAELDQRVVERTAQLEAANKELEAFSYSVSHDLRAPLRHVQGYVDMLGRDAGSQLSDSGRRYMKTIADASREMGVLIDDLLAFSRMGRAEMTETRVDLDALVREARRDMEPVTRERNISWSLPPLPAVQADPAMLRLVVANLLGNAVKFTRSRDPAEIELGCDGTEDGRVILFVRDNGVGFDPQYAHKLFGVFQRLHGTGEFEGTGIGLANVRRIIARHGGRTWAEGAVDKGATFYFTLRAAN